MTQPASPYQQLGGEEKVRALVADFYAAMALDAQAVSGELRRFLDQRFAEVADFLRNAA